MTVRILIGDCRDHLSQIDASSIDSIVTDPPYGLSFMGKGWDHGVPGIEFWTEALRVLKPGGHLLAFGGTRTHHRLMVAIEDAGFEIRDCLMWLYGSGFPKSHDVSKAIDKAIDKAAGAEREIVGSKSTPGGWHHEHTINDDGWKGGAQSLTAPATDAAKQWDGWGTALKPAWEPIILARKPLAGTVAQNVLDHGTGGLNIDGCRIGTDDNLNGGAYSDNRELSTNAVYGEYRRLTPDGYQQPAGRWPANVVLDEDAAALLDAQSGERKSGGKVKGTEPSRTGRNGIYGAYDRIENQPHDDTGGASRFFYTAKASSAERNRGLSGLPERRVDPVNHTDQRVWDIPGSHATPRANHHPTVKPVALMQWLCRLVTPPGGTVLDPFMGSGSTLIAAEREGFNAVGIELDPEYAEIARRRITGDCPLFVEVA